jgi:hypothetical protein
MSEALTRELNFLEQQRRLKEQVIQCCAVPIKFLHAPDHTSSLLQMEAVLAYNRKRLFGK